MLHRDALPLPPTVVAVAAAPVALLCGALTTLRPAAGIAVALMVGFMAVVMIDVRVGLVLWTPIPFVQFLPSLWIGPTVASIILLAAWVGSARGRGHVPLAGRWRVAFAFGLAALMVWLTLTTGWSQDTAESPKRLVAWYTAALVVLVFSTTLRDARHIRLVAGAFIAGGVISVLIGLASTGLRPPDGSLETAAFTEGRLQGGSADPNFLAAGLVPAIVLAGGLAATTRSGLSRLALVPTVALLAIGLAATQSRGGFVAAAAAAVMGFVLLRRHRLMILAGTALVACLVGLWFVNAPGAWERLTSIDEGGNGRRDLWTVALRVAHDHPVGGVGLGRFDEEAPAYVRRPGSLQDVALIVDQPHVAHNAYLQMAAEAGLIGLGLLLLVLAAGFAITYKAATRFAARGDPGLAVLAYALLVAQVSAFVAEIFVSNGHDPRLWILLALGLALDTVGSLPRAER